MASLFPQLEADQPLAGIAKLASQGAALAEGHQVDYLTLENRSLLTRCVSRRVPFTWMINPYRGCEFACKYCYARYTHEFMEMWDGRDFERKIFAKVAAPELLRAELRAAKDKGLPIALGTATDPYQPAEKQFGITRRMLEVLADFERLDFSITTKSVLILRDLDLLTKVSQRHRFSVHITVTTLDDRLARLLEPKAPPPARRLEAVHQLAAARIHVGVNAMPILPGLTDSRRSLEELARCSAQAGAKFLYGNVLFLMPAAMKEFMPFLEREFPHLVKRYRRLYARSAYLRGDYPEQMAKLMAELRARYGLDGRVSTGSRDNCGEVPPAARHPQMSLPFE